MPEKREFASPAAPGESAQHVLLRGDVPIPNHRRIDNDQSVLKEGFKAKH